MLNSKSKLTPKLTKPLLITFICMQLGFIAACSTDPKVETETIYDSVQLISDRLIKVQSDDPKSLYGIVDLESNVIVEPQYQDIELVDANLFIVKQDSKCGVYTLNQSLQIEPKYDAIYQSVTSEHYLEILHNNLYGYIEKETGFTVEPQYKYISISADCIKAVNKKGKTGYVDFKGNTLIPFEYTEGSPFIDGHAIVQDDTGFYSIDLQGHTSEALPINFYLENATYDQFVVASSDMNIENGNNGYAPVVESVTGNLKYINRSGDIVLDTAYSFGLPFDDFNIAAVYRDRKMGLINQSGEEILPPEYDAIIDVLNSGHYLFSKGSQSGLMDKNGQVIFPLSDKEIKFTWHFYYVTKNDITTIYDLDHNNFYELPTKEIDVRSYKDGTYFYKAYQDEAEVWGVKNTNGEVLVPAQYEAMAFYTKEGIIGAKDEKGWRIINTKTQ
ncbi:WG repeat-containing protein [Fusibacter ferrireducens]|uniref:WG repeat-containing protein n=1 Tax=Fusibacter ferrireducens TaxID=2785058 RepID=A0ABR9ZU65_9FIRM|nr:WG repeat-containing protein [Fusibacter ferrireducens]MBF4694004.1 WG repeat-containing protein [Fusibacter ferrireducens]